MALAYPLARPLSFPTSQSITLNSTTAIKNLTILFSGDSLAERLVNVAGNIIFTGGQ